MIAAGYYMKRNGGILISVRDTDKRLKRACKGIRLYGIYHLCNGRNRQKAEQRRHFLYHREKPKEADEGERLLSVMEKGRISCAVNIGHGPPAGPRQCKA